MVRILLFISLFSFWVKADRIIQVDEKQRLVAIKIEPERPIDVNDEVCMKVKEIKISCGVVFKSNEKGILIFITRGKYSFDPKLKFVVVRESLVPQSRMISLGVNFKFPQVRFENLFMPNWSYGILGEGIIFNRNGSSMKGLGALVTLHYYSKVPFRGLWITGGAGIHMVNLLTAEKNGDESQREGVTSLMMLADIGWRFRLSKKWSFAAAAGGHLFFDSRVTAVTGSSGFVPSLIGEFSFIF